MKKLQKKHITKDQIQSVINTFKNSDLTRCTLSLFELLGYNTKRRATLHEKTSQYFIENYVSTNFSPDKAFAKEWKSIDILFQLTSEEIATNNTPFKTENFENQIIESYLFIAIDLSQPDYSRNKLAQITREINKIFSMPAFLIFRYEKNEKQKLTFEIINRRINKQDQSRDVLEKVTLIKDISIENTHRAHLDILYELSLDQIRQNDSVNNFIELNQAWMKILDTKELNKRFYKKLSDWYFWAMNHVHFPDDKEKNTETRNAVNLIRLITRIIFVWFIKEKNLVPETLFDEIFLRDKIKNFNKNENADNYYLAVLQNLFFATLNQKAGERKFAVEGTFNENRSQYGIKTLYRYADLFLVSEKDVLKMFKEIPFLNGGLFDCLDKTVLEIARLRATKKKKIGNACTFVFVTAKSVNILNCIRLKNSLVQTIK